MNKTVQPSLHAEPGSLRFYLQPYQEWQAVKGFSPRTVEAGTLRLLRFIEFCEARGVTDVREVSRHVVERFQKALHMTRRVGKGPLGIKYQNQVLLSLKGFFKWLCKERYVLYNPASELEMPRLPKTLPRAILNQGEVEAILGGVDISTPVGVRDRALMELLYSTGIRRIEVANLKIYDVDLAMGTAFIKEGKGGRDRVVPVGERALFWISKYLEEVRPLLSDAVDEGSLFLSSRGGGGIRLHSVGELVAGYVRKAALHKRGGCHMFRHTCATLMLENGADVRFVQALLGHARLDTTQIYTHVSIQKLKEIHKATHPAKMKTKGTSSPESSLYRPPPPPLPRRGSPRMLG